MGTLEHDNSRSQEPKMAAADLLMVLKGDPDFPFDTYEYGTAITAEVWKRFANAFESYLALDNKEERNKTAVFQALEDVYRTYFILVTRHRMRKFQSRTFHEFFHPILGRCMATLERGHLTTSSIEPLYPFGEPLRERAMKLADSQPFLRIR